jgi:hypothetical protein
MNPETLWDRVNDAINTIIRRDENTETGELLPPCVEGTTLLIYLIVFWNQFCNDAWKYISLSSIYLR